MAVRSPIMERGLRQLVNERPGLELTRTTTSMHEVVAAVTQQTVDIVVIDSNLDGAGGMRLSERLGNHPTRTLICYLIDHIDLQLIRYLTRNGASGFVHTGARDHEIGDALARLGEQAVTMDPHTSRQVAMAAVTGYAVAHDPLSDRDEGLLRLLAEGKTNREIAATLYLSEKTVKNYLSSLFRTIGVRSRTEAALLATRRRQQGVAVGADQPEPAALGVARSRPGGVSGQGAQIEALNHAGFTPSAECSPSWPDSDRRRPPTPGRELPERAPALTAGR